MFTHIIGIELQIPQQILKQAPLLSLVNMKFASANIYESMLPVFMLSKIFGLCSFSISSKEYVASWIAIIFPISVTLLFSSHTISELFMRESTEKILIYILTDIIHVYAGVICSIVIYLFSILFRNKVSKYFDN